MEECAARMGGARTTIRPGAHPASVRVVAL